VERLIEQPVGDSEMLEGHASIGRVHYHLSIYGHYSDLENEPVPIHLKVEGRLTPVDRLDFAEFHQRHADLTLRLADGRTLDFRVTNDEGAIRSTGRGLHVSQT